MDMNNEYLDQNNTPLPSFDAEAELKKIRRDIRKRNWKIILTSLILTAAILFGTVQFAIPALEKQYWDPNASTYLEGIPDLELTMNIYNELFGHGKHFMTVDIQKEGFADYTLDTIFVEYKTKNILSDVSFRTASLTKGDLISPTNFWLDMIPGIFYRDIREWLQKRPKETQFHAKTVRDTLIQLPEYVEVYASVTFPEDIPMERLQQLQKQYEQDSRFLWAILRCQDEDADYEPQCGVHLTDYRSSYYQPKLWSDTAYPNLFCDRYNWTPADMEQHIISMLNFSNDQAQKNTGFLPDDASPNYYQNVLTYFEENGIRSYGCYVIASPRDLLDMMDNGIAALVHPLDARISFT